MTDFLLLDTRVVLTIPVPASVESVAVVVVVLGSVDAVELLFIDDAVSTSLLDLLLADI